jgi:hypothetical protein
MLRTRGCVKKHDLARSIVLEISVKAAATGITL